MIEFLCHQEWAIESGTNFDECRNACRCDFLDDFLPSGIILVNNEKSTPDRVLRNGDLISNIMHRCVGSKCSTVRFHPLIQFLRHRHEPPVAAGPVKILYDGRLPGNDGETLVVEKPGSMPVSAFARGKAHQSTESCFVQVHPTGRYNFNTLLEILKYDYDLPLVHSTCLLKNHNPPYPITDCVDTSFQSARPANLRRNDLRVDRRCVEEAWCLVRRSTQSRGRRQEGIRSTLPGRIPEVSLPQLSSLSLAMKRTNPIPSVVTRSSVRSLYSPSIVRSASMLCIRRDGCVCDYPGVRLYCTHLAHFTRQGVENHLQTAQLRRPKQYQRRAL